MSSRNYVILITFFFTKKRTSITYYRRTRRASGVDQGEDQNICRRNALTGTEEIGYKWFQMNKKLCAHRQLNHVCFHLF